MSDNDWIICIIIVLLCCATFLETIKSYEESEKETYKMVFNEDSILWQYGGESGTLAGFFDWLGYSAGSAIDTAHVRSGTKSIKLFQSNPPPKTDDQRRIYATKYGSHYQTNDYYFSFWAYFDTEFQTMVNTAHGWGPVIGGTMKYWYDGDWNNLKGLRLYWIFSSNMYVFCWLSGNPNPTPNPALAAYSVSGTQVQMSINTWHHFQMYIKKGDMSTGKVQAWIDGNLIFNATTATDPAYWGEPKSGEVYTMGDDHWNMDIQDYTSQDTLVHGIWFDDLVMSTDYVPSSYHVGDTWEEPESPIPPPPPEYYYVNVSAGANGQVVPSGAQTVLYGQNFTATAMPNSNYIMGYWTRNGTQVSTNPQYTITNAIKNQTYNLVAYFTYNPPPTQTFTVVISSGTGGSCIPTGTQTSNVGTPVSVTATADGGYDFSHWTRNGSTYSTSNPVSISGYSGQTITLAAVFEVTPASPPTPPTPTTYTVYVTAGTGGITNYTGVNIIDAGASITVQATPNTNYRFNYWLKDGVNVGSDRNLVVSGTAGDTVNIYAYFQYVPPPLPNEPILPRSDNVGQLSRGVISQYFGKSQKMKPIELSEILNQLKKMKL